MDSYSLFAAEYGFFVKMTVVAFVVIVAGILIRRGASDTRREAD
jgi:hypothetical protein